MKSRWLFVAGVALAGLAVAAADPALARSRHHKVRPVCANPPVQFSLERLLFNGPPHPNGCAPSVFAYGEYIGQDPDPRIRHDLRRDPATGYAYDLAD
jgi:hypothetical protein